MAIYIPITLVAQSDNELVFEYTQPIHGPDPVKPRRLRQIGINKGVVAFEKSTGTFAQVSGNEWDTGFFFMRVCRKISMHLSAGEVTAETAYTA